MFKGIIFSVSTDNLLRNRAGGAHRIATELRAHNWDIEVVDFAMRWPLEYLLMFFETRVDQNTKFVAFSRIFTIWSPILDEFCKWLKTKYPHIKIIFGSMVYESINSEYIDYYVKGYGEKSILALLKYLFSNGEKPAITKSGNDSVLLSLGDWNATPWRDPTIIYEDRDFIHPKEWLSVEFSRGCKFSCAFCNFPMLGVKGDYTRNADSFERQMKDAYDRFGVDRYVVSDETFNDSVEKITKFANVVEKLDFDPIYSSFIRADLMVSRPYEKEELLRMGLVGHFYGIETFNHRAGKSIGKGLDPEKLKHGLMDAKQYFKTHGKGRYRGNISLIAGLPYESEESMQESEDWLVENWHDEGYTYFPLEIPRESLNQSSKFTREYMNYGYRLVDKEPETARRHIGLQTREDLLAWENDYTDHFRVRDRTDEFVARTDNKYFKLGNFQLGSLVHSRKNYTVEELLTLPNETVEHREGYKEEENAIIADYVRKKINYRK